ncbi:hypothetical protein JOF40_001046 [Aeromicrobium fastidiosum]|jgi:hypothetical protein|nr:hypothetical protein [Aeromicrobium fastidiosum]
MKKFIALGLAAAGVFWALGKRSSDTPVDTWAAATDRL